MAVGVATKHAVDATRLPVDRHLRLRLESARHRWGRRGAFWHATELYGKSPQKRH